LEHIRSSEKIKINFNSIMNAQNYNEEIFLFL